MTGFELESARSLLAAAGVRVGRVVLTHPPQGASLAGVQRVARIRLMAQGEVELVVVTVPADPPS